MDESLAQKLTQIEHSLQVSTRERLDWSHPVSVCCGSLGTTHMNISKFGKSLDDILLSKSSVNDNGSKLKCRLSQQASGACDASQFLSDKLCREHMT